ncbi:MAG: hypothetical protein ACXWZF_05565 [Actinomycetota bacterium]
MMLRTLRSVTVGLILLLPALAPAAAGSSVACAAEAAGAPHAALVVGTGSQTLTYCVALDAPTVNGLRLIQLASAQHGLQYRLGFGGQAVCQLAGTGPTGSDCFGDYPDFWGYWHGDSSGSWAWAGSGAASASITDGDVEGWTWGAGDSGTTHPAPPTTAVDDVCDPAEPTPPPDDGGGSGGGGGGDSGGGDGGSGGSGGGSSGDGGGGGGSHAGGGSADGAGTPAGTEGNGGNGNGGKDDDRGGVAEGEAGTDTSSPVGPSTAEPSDVAAVATGSNPGGGGPPVAGMIALALIGCLGIAGWVTLHRRDAGSP